MTNTSTALITGGTSGIGRATANKLAQLGIHVLVVGRDAERGKKTVDELRAAGSKVDFISSDLRDAASARAVAKLTRLPMRVISKRGGIFPAEQSLQLSGQTRKKPPLFMRPTPPSGKPCLALLRRRASVLALP